MHNRFVALLDFILDYPDQPAPERWATRQHKHAQIREISTAPYATVWLALHFTTVDDSCTWQLFGDS